MGIVAVGDSFMELFVAANSGNTSNPTDVLATSSDTETKAMQAQRSKSTSK